MFDGSDLPELSDDLRKHNCIYLQINAGRAGLFA